MPIDERHRIRFHSWLLEQHLDEEVADAILATMPPYDWHDLATKADLALLDRRFDEIGRQFHAVDSRFDRLDDRIGGLATEIRAVLLTLVGVIVSVLLAGAAALFG